MTIRIIGTAAILAAGISFAQAQQLAPSPTLDAVKARGNLECGVHLGLPGFSFANDKGEWSGIDVDYCKALAAAIFGDATKVKYTPTSVQQRWPILQSGQVDMGVYGPSGRSPATSFRAAPPNRPERHTNAAAIGTCICKSSQTQ